MRLLHTARWDFRTYCSRGPRDKSDFRNSQCHYEGLSCFDGQVTYCWKSDTSVAGLLVVHVGFWLYTWGSLSDKDTNRSSRHEQIDSQTHVKCVPIVISTG
jgi:hypothetical protein